MIAYKFPVYAVTIETPKSLNECINTTIICLDYFQSFEKEIKSDGVL